MDRRTFIASGLATGTAAAVSAAMPSIQADGPGSARPGGLVGAVASAPAPTKPPGRLRRSYRIMWDQNHGKLSYHNPPMDGTKQVQQHLGFFDGTPVDAYVCTLGPDCGYAVDYPTKVKGLDFIVDRYERGAKLGDVRYWRYAENLKALWAHGVDPLGVQIKEARRLGIDFWFRLSMNDWHSVDEQGEIFRLSGSQFQADHREYRLGAEGVKGWPPKMAANVAPLQDFAHPEVRQLRLDTMAEACERYDVDGFVFDFMRIPIYFKFGQEERHVPVMTEFMRQSRAILDDIGARKGKKLGLAVRVPNTIAGARRLGFDVPGWVREHLVDIVVASTFFSADLDEDMSEWAELTRNSPVLIHAAIEEAYSAGHTGDIKRVFYNPPTMLPLTVDMIHALAARHWRNGVDGLYTFNWFGTVDSYDYDNREALDNVGNPLRLKYKNKRYVVTRTDGSFPNCLPNPRQIPAPVGREPLRIHMDVADDLTEAGSRVLTRRLYVHVANLLVIDRLEVVLNGQVLSCANPMQPGQYINDSIIWQNYDIPPGVIRQGPNQIELRMLEQNNRVHEELPVEVADLELLIEYSYPNGPWTGYNSRS